MTIPPLLQSIIAFVRKGYPQGVPDRDYLPLFALLRRRLSEEEVAEIAAALAEDEAWQNPAAIGEAIARLIRESATEADIERVRVRLGAVGWDEPGSPGQPAD